MRIDAVSFRLHQDHGGKEDCKLNFHLEAQASTCLAFMTCHSSPRISKFNTLLKMSKATLRKREGGNLIHAACLGPNAAMTHLVTDP